MCVNENCPLKEICRRYMGTPNEHYQSYADFQPDENGKCEFYLAVLPQQKGE